MKQIITKIYLIACICLLQLPAWSQIDKIKEDATNNQNNSSSNNNSSNDNDNNSTNTDNYSNTDIGDGKTNGSDGCFDACASGCASSCFDVVTDGLVWVIGELHDNTMAKRDIDPTVLSFTVRPHVAYGLNHDMTSALPGLRGDWGAFATDLRLNMLFDRDSIGTNTYRNFDWSVFMLNFAAVPYFNLTLGEGFMYENFTNAFYNQHFIGLQLATEDKAWWFHVDGRLTWDYETGNNVFHEANARASYRIFEIKKVYGYVTAGAVFQQYYTQSFSSVQGGFTFNIH